MPPLPVPRTARRLLRVLAAVLVVVVLAGVLVPGYGAHPAVAYPAGAYPAGAVTGPAYATGGTYAITLLTGDVVALHVAADGRQAAWVQEPAAGNGRGEPQIFEQDGRVHVIPAEAAPYLAAGVLDPRLFDLTYLAEHGFDDASRADLPLLLDAPKAPPGAQVVRQLESIDAISVTTDKSRMRAVWESLRGPRQAAAGAAGARLAGADAVWLNGRVEATLSDSVWQVGAPAAWDAGYDGSGVTVAVLDSGHDPDHPDLAGRVVAARNFTDEPDPAGGTAVDGNGHGTHVAATIAGSGAASDGARPGVAPGAGLLVGKVLDSTGAGELDWVIAGMEWAVEQGAQVVNLSLGEPWSSDGTDPMSQAVNRLSESSGALFVVAAGNSGPREQSVGAPGAATAALTVGATTKDDQPAEFSSRGPRWGDLAVKPEIVAPGVGIVAARAGGTSLGNLLDQDYTSLNGTSMATPHVAGAAAVLAQQHPGWHAEQLKARLVSTAEPLPDQPVTFQGAGRLDVAAAVSSPVTVSDGTLSIGRVAGGAGLVARTLTYRNTSGRPVVLRLSTQVTSTGARTEQRPALSLRPSVLVIPPGGQASTQLLLSPARTKPGGYAGNVVARDLRNPATEVHTTVGFAVEGPLRTVTVTGVDRQGEPSAGTAYLWSAETGEFYSGWMSDGATTLQVPDGLYAAVTALQPSDFELWSTSLTIAGEPELAVRRDITLHYDAREAEPVRVTAPRDVHVDTFRVTWHRQVGDRSITSIAGTGLRDTDLYTLPSRHATTGTFELATTWQLVQPLLAAEVPGPDGFPVAPSPWFGSFADPYVGTASLPVVDAGLGTPEEFAGVDAEGAVALVTRRGGSFDQELVAQAAAAAEAGAVMLLAHNDRLGRWREVAPTTALPVYLIDQANGERLRAAQGADPDLVLDLTGIRDAGYSYHLVFTEPRIRAGGTYHVEDHPMATVVSDYRESSDRMGRHEHWVPYAGRSNFGGGQAISRHGPVVRTQYVSADGVQWSRLGQPHGEFPGVYWTASGIRQYQPGQTYHDQWWGPLSRPGVPPLSGLEQAGMPVARFRDAIRILMRHYLYDNGWLSGTIYEQLGDTSELTLRRDGEVVGKSTWPEAQFTVGHEEAEYELELGVVNGPGNFSDLSVRTESTWRFRSGRPEQPRSVLPLVQLDFHLDAGPYNEVPSGVRYPLLVDPGYQPGATGPAGFAVAVEVSYDGGTSWTGAPVTPAGDGLHEATIPAAPVDAGFADLRVVATDAAGNRLTQRIDHAWRVGTPERVTSTD